MGVISAPAERAVFSLDRYVELRGLVARDAISRQLQRHRRAPIVEMRGGAGWGKTSSALVYALEAHRAGAQVTLFDADGSKLCPGAVDGDVLYIIDDCELSEEVTAELLARVQDDARMQIVVCSRERHALIRRAQRLGLIAQLVRVSESRMTGAELIEIGRRRDVHLDAQRAQYVVQASGGWPIVATRFIDLYANGNRDASAGSIDELVTRSFDVVLTALLGAAALPLLARASLSVGIRRERAGEPGPQSGLHRLIEKVRQLGLGEWVRA